MWPQTAVMTKKQGAWRNTYKRSRSGTQPAPAACCLLRSIPYHTIYTIPYTVPYTVPYTRVQRSENGTKRNGIEEIRLRPFSQETRIERCVAPRRPPTNSHRIPSLPCLVLALALALVLAALLFLRSADQLVSVYFARGGGNMYASALNVNVNVYVNVNVILLRNVCYARCMCWLLRLWNFGSIPNTIDGSTLNYSFTCDTSTDETPRLSTSAARTAVSFLRLCSCVFFIYFQSFLVLDISAELMQQIRKLICCILAFTSYKTL